MRRTARSVRRIVADHVGLGLPSVRQSNTNRLSAVHDVAVRDDQTVRREEEAGSSARWASRRPATMADLDADDCGADDVDRADDGARVRIEQLVVIDRGSTFPDRR